MPWATVPEMLGDENMTAYEAIKARRTIRKFQQKPVSHDLLVHLADCGRMSASAANLQPIKYALINNPELTSKIFPLTKWAGYLKDGTPKENEQPPAYIAIIGDKDINKNALENEAGLVMSTIMIAARNKISAHAVWVQFAAMKLTDFFHCRKICIHFI